MDAMVTMVAMVTMFYYCTGLQVLGCNTGSFNILALLKGHTQGPPQACTDDRSYFVCGTFVIRMTSVADNKIYFKKGDMGDVLERIYRSIL